MPNSLHDFRADQLHVVDLRGIKSKARLLAALGENLELPEYYGKNFDALADCLMDSDWARGERVTIVLLGCTAAERALGEHWATLIEVLRDACAWWKDHDKDFDVLLC